MKKSINLIVFVLIVLSMVVTACSPAATAAPTAASGATTAPATNAERKTLRVAFIPTVVHPWFYDVYLGAVDQAEFLSSQLPYDIKVEYYAPDKPDISVQIAMIEQVAATNPEGIAICPLDVSALTPIVEELKNRGIAIGLINYYPPAEWTNVVGTANNFIIQGNTVAQLVVDAIGEKGKVAVMHGNDANTHNTRYKGIVDYLANYPDITVVDAGFGNDDFNTSSQLAAATIAANPDLVAFTCVDATAPTAIANAVRESGKQDQITVIGMESTVEIYQAIADGTIKATVASKAFTQGKTLLLNIWQKMEGMETIVFADTGLDVITKDNVSNFYQP